MSKNLPMPTRDEQDTLRKIIAEQLLFGKITQGEALRQMRTEILFLNQTQFAKLVGLSRKTISDIENNRENCTVYAINRAFKPFGLTIGIVPKHQNLLHKIIARRVYHKFSDNIEHWIQSHFSEEEKKWYVIIQPSIKIVLEQMKQFFRIN